MSWYDFLIAQRMGPQGQTPMTPNIPPQAPPMSTNTPPQAFQPPGMSAPMQQPPMGTGGYNPPQEFTAPGMGGPGQVSPYGQLAAPPMGGNLPPQAQGTPNRNAFAGMYESPFERNYLNRYDRER